ncbi:MAG: RusA family crossover junction endodeoxyribonuclease [Eubacteriales bacterium]|nr:RusA family crossover junction endodeoxyribonuclease [Eubacteriales bacterium]
MKFTIPGEPTGKARPRVTKWGTYNTEKTVLYENLVKLCYQEQRNTYTEKPVFMSIHAFYGIPKSTPKKNINLMLSGEIKPCKKPDIDNIAKIIADALNGIAYKDDTQIIEMNIKKSYGETPRVEVEITGLLV